MRAAIVIAPYHTNGGYPPLGAAHLNAVLRTEGSHVDVFDLQYVLATDDPSLFFDLRRHHGIAKNLHVVQPILDLRFVLTCLYGDDYPDFDWPLTNDVCVVDNLHTSERALRRRAYTDLAVRLRQQAREFASTVAASRPDLALFSTYIPNVLLSLLIAQQLKRLLPEVTVLFGGPGSSVPQTRRFILDSGLADGIAVRDGEPILREIVRRGSTEGELFLDVDGVVTASSQETPVAPALIDLDSLPFPDFTGFPSPGEAFAQYQHNWKNEYRSKCFDTFMLPVQTSRGCSMRCAFCSESAFWARFNPRSPASIIEEIREQKARYGTECFSFNASLINHDEAWHEQFLSDLCAADLDITWWGYYRPTRDLSPGIIKLMVRAGCRMVSLGVESFSQPALDGMRKGTNNTEALEAVAALTEGGVFVDFALLSGFPVKGHDLQSEYDANIQHLRRLKDRLGGQKIDISVGHLLRLESYSHLCAQPESFGITKSADVIELPEALSALRPSVSKLSWFWKSEVSHEEKLKYSRRLALFVERVFGAG